MLAHICPEALPLVLVEQCVATVPKVPVAIEGPAEARPQEYGEPHRRIAADPRECDHVVDQGARQREAVKPGVGRSQVAEVAQRARHARHERRPRDLPVLEERGRAPRRHPYRQALLRQVQQQTMRGDQRSVVGRRNRIAVQELDSLGVGHAQRIARSGRAAPAARASMSRPPNARRIRALHSTARYCFRA